MIIYHPGSYIRPSSNLCFTFQNLAFIFSHRTPALTVTPWVEALLSDQVAWKLTTTVKTYKGTAFTSYWKNLAAENFTRIAKAVHCHSLALVLFNEWQCNFWSCPGQLKRFKSKDEWRCSIDQFIKHFFGISKNARQFSYCHLIYKQMLEKVFCSYIVPSFSSGKHLFYKAWGEVVLMRF